MTMITLGNGKTVGWAPDEHPEWEYDDHGDWQPVIDGRLTVLLPQDGETKEQASHE